MKIEKELLALYREYPCRTLPNAFWKTAGKLADGCFETRYGAAGELRSLAVWHGRACLAFWCEDPLHQEAVTSRLAQCDFALVHAHSLAVVPEGTFCQRQPYFRLSRSGPAAPSVCPPGFTIRDARPEAEVGQVVGLIKRCYANMDISPEAVRQWLDHPVYDPEGWVWVVDSGTGEAVGLGIAERDARVSEASLEWIQVLPEFQGQGLGTVLVMELLRRAAGKVNFTTVSGKRDHSAQPERLYRTCGFHGSDIWWFLAQ